MSEWRTPIRCYVSPAGNNKIADWHVRLSAQEKADADAFLQIMRKTADWQMPDYRRQLRAIKGVKASQVRGLGEIRWPSGNKQHRLLGFFGDGVWYAVHGCTHKQNIYDPADALATAVKRKNEIQKGEVKTVEYDL
jgi:hypothetical protein